MRKLLLVLIAFIALATFIRAFETLDAEDVSSISRHQQLTKQENVLQ